MSRRATLGLARTGTWSGNGSGDIFVAFSTANRFERADEARERTLRWYNPGHMDPLFLATVEAVEEAVLNALMKAETMTGINNTTVEALPVRSAQGRDEEVRTVTRLMAIPTTTTTTTPTTLCQRKEICG